MQMTAKSDGMRDFYKVLTDAHFVMEHPDCIHFEGTLYILNNKTRRVVKRLQIDIYHDN
jgi:hypothetical protein